MFGLEFLSLNLGVNEHLCFQHLYVFGYPRLHQRAPSQE